MNIKDCEQFLLEKRAQLTTSRKEHQELEASVNVDANSLKLYKEAREIFSEVGIVAQAEVKSVIESLVTQALQAVFDEKHEFVMKDGIKRNQPETEFFVCIDGKLRALKGEQGRGIKEVISFCLRIILWAIQSPRTTPTLIFDEPFSKLDKIDLENEGRLRRMGKMIKKLSEMLRLQLIIITHEEQLIEIADTAYYVKLLAKDTSQVEKVV